MGNALTLRASCHGRKASGGGHSFPRHQCLVVIFVTAVPSMIIGLKGILFGNGPQPARLIDHLIFNFDIGLRNTLLFIFIILNGQLCRDSPDSNSFHLPGNKNFTFNVI